MSTLLTEEKQGAKGEGLKGFAEDIRDLLAFSEVPQRYQDIKEHFAEDEKYFEEDLDYIREALDYLEDQDKVKPDFRLDGEIPQDAYSISDYEAI